MITADTITDEQIRELLSTGLTAKQEADCWTVLGTPRFMCKGAARRLAEILNARAKGGAG